MLTRSTHLNNLFDQLNQQQSILEYGRAPSFSANEKLSIGYILQISRMLLHMKPHN